MDNHLPRDLNMWEAVKESISPNAGRAPKNIRKPAFPKRLRALPPPQKALLHTLDLHGLPLEEAFQAFKCFVQLHQKAGSLKICVITGKGKQGQGLIRKELPLWLETPLFRPKINAVRWKNDGGTAEIAFKRRAL